MALNNPFQVRDYYNTIFYFDLITGGCGVPQPSVIEIFGAKDSGKSTIAQSNVVWFKQSKPKGKVLYIDSEDKVDEYRFLHFLISNNISESDVKLFRSSYVEEIFAEIDLFLKDCAVEGIPALIVWDSVASITLKPKTKRNRQGEEVEEKTGYADAKTTAYFTSEFPKFIPKIRLANATVILVNQVRQNIKTGRGYTTKRGEFMKHIASIRLSASGKAVVEKLGDIDISKGMLSEVKAVKNHLFSIRDIPIFIKIDADKIDEMQSFYETALAWNIIQKAGAWKYIKVGDKEFKWRSDSEFMKIVADNPDVVDLIKYLSIKKIAVEPISKVKTIEMVWDIEERLGLPKTELDDNEQRLYDKIKELKEAE